VPLLGVIPSDEMLMEFEFSGRPLVELGDESPVYRSVAEMMARIL
jgi:CO dehydrogenase nickel-insertion accessory protein CooC1